MLGEWMEKFLNLKLIKIYIMIIGSKRLKSVI